MLTATGITKHYGRQLILDDVSLSIGQRGRVGVVGPNGIGKSTFMRILAGLERADSGRIERTPPSLTTGYLPQEPTARAGETLRAYLARRTGVAEAELDLDRVTAALDGEPSRIDEYTAALDHFLALGGGDFDVRTKQVLADVGLPEDRLEVAMADLSGGQAARAALAAILLARFDVFLLDEPTNNLDFDGLARLEEFMAGVPGAIVVVSHDRAFLDRAVERILEIQEESHRATEYAGGWSEYVEAREVARTQQYEAFEKFRAERGRLEERLRTQRTWAVSGASKEKKKPKDNDKAQRDWRINRTEKQASKVRITEQRLVHLERDKVDKPWEGWQLRLLFKPEARSGDVVARLEHATVTRGTFTLGPVDLEVRWQDRIAIVGPNGSGKTTLLLALLGELPLASGKRFLGPGVKVGSMDQARHMYATEDTLLATFMRNAAIAEISEARALLAKFGLGPGHVQRAGRRLSPGERSRATLATLMATGVNCLVLDEPTNHLDLAAIEELERALDEYDGTLLLVSHDRRLLDAVKTTSTIAVDGGRVTVPGRGEPLLYEER